MLARVWRENPAALCRGIGGMRFACPPYALPQEFFSMLLSELEGAPFFGNYAVGYGIGNGLGTLVGIGHRCPCPQVDVGFQYPVLVLALPA